MVLVKNHFGLKNWTKVSQALSGQKTAQQCFERYTNILDPKLDLINNRKAWKQVDVNKLKDLVSQHLHENP